MFYNFAIKAILLNNVTDDKSQPHLEEPIKGRHFYTKEVRQGYKKK